MLSEVSPTYRSVRYWDSWNVSLALGTSRITYNTNHRDSDEAKRESTVTAGLTPYHVQYFSLLTVTAQPSRWLPQLSYPYLVTFPAPLASKIRWIKGSIGCAFRGFPPLTYRCMHNWDFTVCTKPMSGRANPEPRGRGFPPSPSSSDTGPPIHM